VSAPLRVVGADDARPARAFLVSLLATIPEVEIVGEAATGPEAIELIERERPDLALLDLQMPEVDGLGVVRLLDVEHLPLVAFVTAYDEFAVRAFELNAIDYLLKPVERARLCETISRALERVERREESAERLRRVAAEIDTSADRGRLERIPVRHRDAILLLPVDRIASVVAEGELLHITTVTNERYILSYRLKDLEARLDPSRFVRLSRGAIASVDAISRVVPMPGGTFRIELANGQELSSSRLQSRVLRDELLKL
jgi:two-component system LytT family response regulator